MMRILLIGLGVVALLLVGTGLWLYTPDKSRSALEATYLRAPSDYVEAAGMTLHVREEGQGPAIVLIHGFGSSLHTWDAWAADLAKDHRVIRFDLPGFGLTGPDPTGDYSMDRTVAVIHALLDAKGVERATLVGNSLGGLAAWNYAARHPGRVEKLALLAPGGYPRAGVAFDQTVEVPSAFKAMRYTLPEGTVRASLQPLFGNPAALTPELLTRYRDMMLAPGVRQAMVDRLEEFKLSNPDPALATIQAPTLLMWGERDIMVPARDAEKFAAALPNERLVLYPGVGHMPMEEIPTQSLADLRAFLAE